MANNKEGDTKMTNNKEGDTKQRETNELVEVKDLTTARAAMRSAVSDLKNKCEESISNNTELTAVRTEDKWLFFNSEHEVTGKELNGLITQIQENFTRNGEQRRLLWEQLIDVYKTIDRLDADYLSKIEKSFEQINKNCERIQANHQDICRDQRELENHRDHVDKLIQGHEISLNVLKQFKTRIDNLTHLEETNEVLGKVHLLERRMKIWGIAVLSAIVAAIVIVAAMVF